MSDIDRLAASMYGSNRLEETASLVSLDTQTYIGIAKADSEEGLVEVVLSDDVTQPDGGIWDGSEWQGDDDIGTSVTLPTTQSVREGERVLVSAFGGNTIATPVVTGVIGGGDSLRQDVEAVNQYFWTDEDGVHVTQIPQDEFVQSPSGPNQLSNSEGILLRDGETYLSAFTPDGVSIYDGQGNEDGNVVAEFSGDGARVGYEGSSNVTVTEDGMTFNNYVGLDVGSIESSSVSARLPITKKHSLFVVPMYPMAYTTFSGAPEFYQNRYVFLSVTFMASGASRTVSASITAYDTTVNVGNQLYARLEQVSSDKFKVGLANATSTTFTNAVMTVRWYETILAPAYRFGDGTVSGAFAFSEGYGTTASGNYSHAEGTGTTSSSIASHAEGNGTSATGGGCHSEGINTTASGGSSHAEGNGSRATALGSHAQNLYTIAAKYAQTALGRYNVEDATSGSYGQYAVIVGNGTSDSNRSNALTVDWQGNVVCGTVNGIDIASAITGVAQFQGELDSQATLEAADYEAGWFWVVTAAGTYAGNVCEQGDMVYAVEDKGEAYAASDFVVVQANLGPTTNLSNIDIDQICV